MTCKSATSSTPATATCTRCCVRSTRCARGARGRRRRYRDPRHVYRDGRHDQRRGRHWSRETRSALLVFEATTSRRWNACATCSIRAGSSIRQDFPTGAQCGEVARRRQSLDGDGLDLHRHAGERRRRRSGIGRVRATGRRRRSVRHRRCSRSATHRAVATSPCTRTVCAAFVITTRDMTAGIEAARRWPKSNACSANTDSGFCSTHRTRARDRRRNAGRWLAGRRRAAYGRPRDLVIGSTVALTDGTLADAGGMVAQNVTGYDMSKLYVGSLGTLGLIVRADFKDAPAARCAEARRGAARRRPPRPRDRRARAV